MNFSPSHDAQKGFTLIELLVVISIIGVLASIVLASLSSARSKSRDAVRKQDMLEVQKALELYYDDHGSYPSTTQYWYGLANNSAISGLTRSGPNGYIPNLAPKYIPILPEDPSGDTSGWSGFLYNSNGQEYKFLDSANGPESWPAAGEAFYDPVRPGNAWMVCSDLPGPPDYCGYDNQPIWLTM